MFAIQMKCSDRNKINVGRQAIWRLPDDAMRKKKMRNIDGEEQEQCESEATRRLKRNQDWRAL